jgi:hypothetical protein
MMSGSVLITYPGFGPFKGLTNLLSGTTVQRMTSLPLRELLRHPAVVKRLTAAGESVQVTDNGKPLWVLRSATAPSLAEDDKQLVDDELDAMLAERRSAVSAGQLIVDSRMP